MSRTNCSRLLLATGLAGLTLTLAAPSIAATAPLNAASAPTARMAGHGQAAVALPDGFRPEGVTSGPGDRYYTGSLADGRIWTGDLSKGTGRQLVSGVTGRALRGMQYDRRTGLLWVVGQDGAAPNATGIVLVIEARSGKILDRIVVPGAVFLNDIVLAGKAAWVTDSGVDKLTRISLGSKKLSQIALGGPWPTPAGNRANGIRQLPDGSLLIDNSTAGGLWQVNRKTGVVTQIPVKGGPGITGGDGLELRGNTLYVVRGSGQQEVSVLRLKQHKGSWTATWQGALTSSALDVPSTATLVGSTLWAVNARFGVANPDAAAYQIVPLPLCSRG